MALKRSLSVSFEVVREKGPPHMRTFLTSCRVGDVVTEGEGNSKKVCHFSYAGHKVKLFETTLRITSVKRMFKEFGLSREFQC
jgi:dsRNA-specific ribonuclease